MKNFDPTPREDDIFDGIDELLNSGAPMSDDPDTAYEDIISEVNFKRATNNSIDTSAISMAMGSESSKRRPSSNEPQKKEPSPPPGFFNTATSPITDDFDKIFQEITSGLNSNLSDIPSKPAAPAPVKPSPVAVAEKGVTAPVKPSAVAVAEKGVTAPVAANVTAHAKAPQKTSAKTSSGAGANKGLISEGSKSAIEYGIAGTETPDTSEFAPKLAPSKTAATKPADGNIISSIAKRANSAPPEKKEDKPAPAKDDAAFSEDFAKVFTPIKNTEHESDEDFEESEVNYKEAPTITQRILKHLRKPLPPLEALPQNAFARAQNYALSLRARSFVAFLLTLPLIYISLCQVFRFLPAPDMLLYNHDSYRYMLITSVLLILIMLCAVDIIAKGFSDLYHLRPGVETLVAISCCTSLIHVISLCIELPESITIIGFTPYTAVTGVVLFFTLWASYYQYKAYLKTYEASTQSEDVTPVYHVQGLWNSSSGFIKASGSLEGFVSRTEAPDLSRRFMSYLAPLLLVASLLFAVIVSVGKGRPGYFFWAWSAISLATTPISTLFVFALPFSRVASRLFRMGAAVAGWSAARDFRDGVYAVSKDSDFFPSGTVALNGLKVYGEKNSYEKITSYACTLLKDTDNSLYHALDKIAKDSGLPTLEVSHLEYDEGGGIRGEILGDRVLIGNSAFMLRMGVRLPKELNIKKAVYVSVNMQLGGIFAVNYIAASQVENALRILNRSKITPLLAVKDFNITPLMLKEKFGIDTNDVEYPTVEGRLNLSAATRENSSIPLGIVTKEGLAPFAECVAGAARLYKVSRINLFLNILCTILGVLAMFYLTYLGTADAALSILPGHVLLYFFVWWLPIWLISAVANRY